MKGPRRRTSAPKPLLPGGPQRRLCPGWPQGTHRPRASLAAGPQRAAGPGPAPAFPTPPLADPDGGRCCRNERGLHVRSLPGGETSRAPCVQRPAAATAASHRQLRTAAAEPRSAQLEIRTGCPTIRPSRPVRATCWRRSAIRHRSRGWSGRCGCRRRSLAGGVPQAACGTEDRRRSGPGRGVKAAGGVSRPRAGRAGGRGVFARWERRGNEAVADGCGLVRTG